MLNLLKWLKIVELKDVVLKVFSKSVSGEHLHSVATLMLLKWKRLREHFAIFSFPYPAKNQQWNCHK